jgi:hypothetical protein
MSSIKKYLNADMLVVAIIFSAFFFTIGAFVADASYSHCPIEVVK